MIPVNMSERVGGKDGKKAAEQISAGKRYCYRILGGSFSAMNAGKDYGKRDRGRSNGGRRLTRGKKKGALSELERTY